MEKQNTIILLETLNNALRLRTLECVILTSEKLGVIEREQKRREADAIEDQIREAIKVVQADIDSQETFYGMSRWNIEDVHEAVERAQEDHDDDDCTLTDDEAEAILIELDKALSSLGIERGHEVIDQKVEEIVNKKKGLEFCVGCHELRSEKVMVDIESGGRSNRLCDECRGVGTEDETGAICQFCNKRRLTARDVEVMIGTGPKTKMVSACDKCMPF